MVNNHYNYKMLIGNYHHSIQARGRLAIPAAFRKQLLEGAILTRGIESNLNLLPFNTWSKLTQNLGSHPLVSTQDRQIRRLIAHSAISADFDDQGRLHISKDLLLWAHLDKKVVIAGSINWVEIWDIDLYLEHLKDLEDKSQDIAASISKS